MIDGITIKFEILNFDRWKEAVNLDIWVSVSDVGEVKTKTRFGKTTTTHRARWQTFDLIVKEVVDITTEEKAFHLTIKGSLHKNQFGGTNYQPFTYELLQEQITHLCTTLYIEPENAQISTLEVGVNVVTPFEVSPFLFNNLISYKGNHFNRYTAEANGFCLGVFCEMSQYRVKVYDKGKQNNLSYNLMRFEKRFLKMQQLQRPGIKCLADLQDREKVKGLLIHLTEAWQNVLIYDIEPEILKNANCGIVQSSTLFENKDTIKKGDIDLLTRGDNPKFWEKLKKENVRQFNYQREKFRELVAKFGTNWHNIVNDLIISEWDKLFKNCTNLPSGENPKLYEFTIKIKGKNVQNRVCQTCGKDISHQVPNSKYCSPKSVGEVAAHKRRNGNSNPRNNLKNKLKKITSRGVLFDIVPYLVTSRQKAL